MIYIYDTIIEPYETILRRYGATYKLENRTRMGGQVFYTFAATNREKILVIPYFAEQYRQVERFYLKMNGYKKLETCIGHIKRELGQRIRLEDFPNEESETGVMTMITIDYHDIRVQFEYMNNHLSLSADFEILDNNIFGSGIIVTMNLNMEEAL